MRLFDSPDEIITTLKKALTEIDPEWQSYDGLIVPGSHKPTLVEEKISAIKQARETGLPALLICFGHQLGAIEYARNVLGIKDATSEEFGQGTFVVKKRGTLKVGEKDGQNYWNNYEVSISWEQPRNFFSSQYHPEFGSSFFQPHPLLVSFLRYASQT